MNEEHEALPSWKDTPNFIGISLRDYFAAAALQGMLACPEESCEAVMLSEEAYKYADAMLKTRETV